MKGAKTMTRPGQKPDETAIEYLRRAVSNCNFETESILEQLPSVEAVLDYFDLWHTYNTDFWSGILEGIAEGDDPTPARKFVAKYNLGDNWLADIDHAINCREVTA